MNFRPRFLLVALLVSVISVFAALSMAQAANLLNDGGFNGAFVSQPGINGMVPAGWTAINLAGNPTWTDDGFAAGDRTEGDNAAIIVSEHIEDCCNQSNDGWPFTGVLSQSVHGVISGTAYSMAATIVDFCGGTYRGGDCAGNGYYAGKSVGIDPTGGTNPTATTVIWGAENTFNNQYRDVTAAGRALSSTVTVFVKVRWPYKWHGMFTIIDAGYLVQAPVATITTTSQTTSGPIALNWSAQVPQNPSADYPGIQLAYNVQVFNPTVGHWTDLLLDTSVTHIVYTGTVGNTYQFRVLPYLGFPPNHRFDGLYSNPISVTVGDFTAPSSSVTPLAPVQYAPTFTVAWSGTDNVSPPAALLYDVQVRDGAVGAWTTWLTTTTQTSAQFSGLPGHTYSFRSRAHDAAANVEAYPANPDASTSVALAVSGAILNLREEPVAFATASLNPSALPGGPAGPDGQYSLWVTASNTYALTAAHDGFGALPPVGNITANGANVTGVNAVLPPPIDLAANGQFESGDLSGWTGSITAAPVVTSTAHSGGFGAALGGTPGAVTTLQQTLFLSPTLSAPTLSYLYRAPVGGADLFTVAVQGDGLPSVTNPPIPANEWTHQWLDLSPYAGQTITLTFTFQPLGAPDRMLLDEVSVGDAGTAPLFRVYLPAIIR